MDGMSWRDRLHSIAVRYERDLSALALAVRDSRVSWPARLVVLLVLAYIVSPIDLIPDSAHVLGVLDDLIVLSLGFVLAVRLVPTDVMADCRARAAARPLRDLRWWVVVLIVLSWQIVLVLLARWWGGESALICNPAAGELVALVSVAQIARADGGGRGARDVRESDPGSDARVGRSAVPGRPIGESTLQPARGRRCAATARA
jgi:uncharacterized membrane protein YkvA (DUF1232 family)